MENEGCPRDFQTKKNKFNELNVNECVVGEPRAMQSLSEDRETRRSTHKKYKRVGEGRPIDKDRTCELRKEEEEEEGRKGDTKVEEEFREPFTEPQLAM